MALEFEDLIWRPELLERGFTWGELKQLRKRWLNSRHALTQSLAQYNQAPSDEGRQMLETAEEAINEAYEELMFAAHTELGWFEKPRSVRFYEWAKRIGLPTFGLSWRSKLWYNLLAWEFRKWLWRSYEKSGFRGSVTLNQLLRRLPQWQPDIYGDPIWLDTQAQKEITLAYRWLLLRGRYLTYREWTVFRELLHSSTDL
jgi:hypothetical protein